MSMKSSTGSWSTSTHASRILNNSSWYRKKQSSSPLNPLCFFWPKGLQATRSANYIRPLLLLIVKVHLHTSFPLWLLQMQRYNGHLPLDLHKKTELIVQGPPSCLLWINRAEIMTGSSEQKQNLWDCGDVLWPLRDRRLVLASQDTDESKLKLTARWSKSTSALLGKSAKLKRCDTFI